MARRPMRARGCPGIRHAAKARCVSPPPARWPRARCPHLGMPLPESPGERARPAPSGSAVRVGLPHRVISTTRIRLRALGGHQRGAPSRCRRHPRLDRSDPGGPAARSPGRRSRAPFAVKLAWLGNGAAGGKQRRGREAITPARCSAGGTISTGVGGRWRWREPASPARPIVSGPSAIAKPTACRGGEARPQRLADDRSQGRRGEIADSADAPLLPACPSLPTGHAGRPATSASGPAALPPSQPTAANTDAPRGQIVGESPKRPGGNPPRSRHMSRRTIEPGIASRREAM